MSGGAQVSVNVMLPENHEFTEGAPLHFEARLKKGDKFKNLKSSELLEPPKGLPLTFDLGGEMEHNAVLEVDLEVPYCTTVRPKLCKFKSVKLTQPVSFKAEGKSNLELRAQIQQ